MIGLGTLAKLAKGGIGPDELGEILSAMGVELEMAPVPFPEASKAYRDSAAGLTGPGAKLHRLSGKMKNGDRLEALLVLIPSPASTGKGLTPGAIAA